ncbi:MAG TPA: efflux RND transporter permease subunit [Armatimonadota bacterium]|jgi:HAE1 family hydrophobic/amphiphilic exporter-1
MDIARFSVTRPVAVTMRIASLVLFGAICVTRLPVDLLPQVSIPTVVVVTNWPNVAPEEIEAQVTRPIEEALSATPNMQQVTSTTSEGSSSVRVQFRWGTDVGQAAVDVMQLVERAQGRFPDDPTLQTPLVFKFDPSQLPILIYGVSGIQDPVKLRTLLDNQVTPMLESADGVASAVVTGGQERAIIVDVDPVRLRSVHLSLNDVVKRIAQENLNLPAGIAKQSNTEYTIRTLGWYSSPADIAKTPVGSFNGQLVALGEVADVRDSHTDTRLFTRLNGQPAAGIVISKQSGGNTVGTAQSVFEKLDRVQKLYPNLKFSLAYDQSRFIANSVNDVRNNALLGGVLAVIVLLFFLRNVRSTLVVALSIPISIISTFAILYMCGFTLNTMSLGGLALATGLIVDDAVVVLENIFRHIERDKKHAPEAAVSGTNEIATAVLSSTLTIMVVFLPLFLIKGQAGQMFTQFALVVVFSMAVSWLDAMTVVPMLASRLISGDAHRESMEGTGRRNWLERRFQKFGQWLEALDAWYRNALRWTLRHRWGVIGGAIAVSAASFSLVPLVGSELMPQTDSGDFQVIVKLPIGTALSTTDALMRQVERIVLSNPNVETAFSAAGTTLSNRGNTTALNPNQGSVTVKLKHDRRQSTLVVMGDIRKALNRMPGARPRVNQYDVVSQIMTGGNQTVDVNIFGENLATLSALSRQVISRVRNVPGYENVDVNWQEATPEVQWKVDRQKALQLGVSFSDVANTINTATNGTIASYYHENGFQYPIQVQAPENTRQTVADLENLVISPSTPSSGPNHDVMLRQVATPSYNIGPSQITRQDRQRYIAVTGQPQGRSAGDIQNDIKTALVGLKMPDGYFWDWGTNQKRQQEEFSGLWLAILLAVGLIYMLLASQFESFVHPLTVLLSVPLCAVGVILALFLSGRAFGLTAFIGLLMLVGIVVKNGILLVDYTNVLRGRGMSRDEAVLAAGPTRLRPILMTACAAILGMLPLALGLGEGSETQAPMATAVCGGLLTSTILTLFIVPSVYTLFDDAARFFRGDELDLAAPSLVEPTLVAVEAGHDDRSSHAL